MEQKAIIIGAGPAGLTAAYELLKKTNIKPIILECSNEVGGISKTINYKGNRIDVGGHRFFTKSNEINKIWEEIMPTQGKPSSDDILLNRNIELNVNGPDPEKEDNVMLLRNRVSRIYYLNKFFDYPISMKPKNLINMGFIRSTKAGFSYIKSSIIKKEEINLENFYINRFGKELYRMFFKNYTTKVWGKTPDQIDASWGKERVKGLSLKNALLSSFIKKEKRETSLIKNFKYPKLGPGSLFEEMANRCIKLGAEIRMNSKVTKINIKDNRVVSIVINNKETINGDYFISSMPLKDLVNAIGSDNMPNDIYNIGNQLPYRDFMTVGLLLKGLKIRNKTKIKTINSRIPDTWIYVQEKAIKLGRIQIFNNWSPYMAKDNINTIWLGLEYFVNENDNMWSMEDNKFIDMAIEEMSKMGMINKEDVLDSCIFRIKKAYPAYFDSYKDINKLKDYLLTIDNLYCVGRNGQHRYNNMDHSMLTSIETIDCILNKNATKKKIWEVNI